MIFLVSIILSPCIYWIFLVIMKGDHSVYYKAFLYPVEFFHLAIYEDKSVENSFLNLLETSFLVLLSLAQTLFILSFNGD